MTGPSPMRCRVSALASGTTRVEVYDDIGPGGFFSDGLTAKDFAGRLQGVTGPLDIHINSAGGDVGDGIAIGNAIRAYAGRKRTVVDGLAASIASVIMQAGDERVVEPGAMVMVHDPFTAVMGNADELRKIAETLDKHGQNLADQYAARSGTKSSSEWRDIMRAETWFTADEAVAAGLADHVGTAAARLPQGVDVESLAAQAPGRIMAALRSLPRAADMTPDGDGDAPAGAKCKTCKGSGRLKHPGTGKNGMQCPGCGGTGTYDPDHDGDDDSTAEGDTDHDYVLPDGSPGPKALTEERVRALIREELRPALAEEVKAAAFEALHGEAAKVDNSAWDSSKAWHNGAQADDPAAFYKAVCAGEKTDGDPATQAHWALPYRYTPDSPPNAGGVRAAWGVLNGSMGGVADLADRDAVEAKVKSLMKQVNPDWSPDNSTDTSVFSRRLKEMRGALPSLKGADA